VVLYVLLAGLTLQSVATALERREFPRPGPLVNVGDHQLHMHCLGSGVPTVILEAPAAGMSAAWGWVQPAVAERTRVCSYDRAGLGWSERPERAYTPSDTAAELRALLDGSGEHGPFVVVGQGLGAAHATLFASRFADHTAALVLVDAPPQASSPARESARESIATRFPGAWPWLARIGVLRLGRMLSGKAAGLPDPAAGALAAFLNRPDHLTQAARELAHAGEVIALAAQVKPKAPATSLDALGQARVTFLTDKAAAGRVSSAILDAVRSVREKAAPIRP
jgi:pimeloyl-ACP methyl ester carboxylesterase